MAVDYDTEKYLIEKFKCDCSYDPYRGTLFCTAPTEKLDDIEAYLSSLGYTYSVFTDKEITFIEIWDAGGEYEIIFIPEGEE